VGGGGGGLKSGELWVTELTPSLHLFGEKRTLRKYHIKPVTFVTATSPSYELKIHFNSLTEVLDSSNKSYKKGDKLCINEFINTQSKVQYTT
jgi:hypothetical protein